jgi:hypothetical protein
MAKGANHVSSRFAKRAEKHQPNDTVHSKRLDCANNAVKSKPKVAA